jgi:hypothetical protein
MLLCGVLQIAVAVSHERNVLLKALADYDPSLDRTRWPRHLVDLANIRGRATPYLTYLVARLWRGNSVHESSPT